MEENTQVKEQPNSVEISINAKGEYSGKVKVYAETIEEAYKLALEKSSELGTLISMSTILKRKIINLHLNGGFFKKWYN